MAYISFTNLKESEFDNIVSEKDKRQDCVFKQLELQVHDTYKKGKK